MSSRRVAGPGLIAKLRLLAPYFAGTKWAFALSALGAAVSGACEGGVVWLMKPLVDQGLQHPSFPLWAIPVAIVGLVAVRGLAGFVVDYVLAWAANHATSRMRSRMFAGLLGAHPTSSALPPRAASSTRWCTRC